MATKVLFVGESWVIHMIHQKGFDCFTSTKYEEGATYLLDELRKVNFDIDYLPSHEVQVRFPQTIEELEKYDAIVLSDIGANTFLLQNHTFYDMKISSNGLELIKDFVGNGGGLLMIGGYLSFMGIEAKANYKNTPLADVLPVEMMDRDDRVEVPQGFIPVSVNDDPIIGDLGEWPKLLGYNRVVVKHDAKELLRVNSDPILATGYYKKGKTAVFLSDCAPHWGSMDFVNWKYYSLFWSRLLGSLSVNKAKMSL
ncbi:glutamine amidotransferase [Sporolactobacillus kofuensis]|uniref:Glutamine amidotransferase n=1 Tax=Sporolactobacillus kofuensis TaxID=269672 RepID=A0ABW1WFR0_9BACL|nr:glutamine amidotransferase [Sporolactobacillus kofuensis]MCO7174826.1 glutamine amidotransferase [Sporolactobacillus kofuensis]